MPCPNTRTASRVAVNSAANCILCFTPKASFLGNPQKNSEGVHTTSGCHRSAQTQPTPGWKCFAGLRDARRLGPKPCVTTNLAAVYRDPGNMSTICHPAPAIQTVGEGDREGSAR